MTEHYQSDMSHLYRNYGTITIPVTAYHESRIHFRGTPEELFIDSEWMYPDDGFPSLEPVYSTFRVVVTHGSKYISSAFTVAIEELLKYDYSESTNTLDLEFSYVRITGSDETILPPLVTHILQGPHGHLAIFVEGAEDEAHRMVSTRYKEFYHGGKKYYLYDTMRIVRNLGKDEKLDPIEYTLAVIALAYPEKLQPKEQTVFFGNIVNSYINGVYGVNAEKMPVQ